LLSLVPSTNYKLDYIYSLGWGERDGFKLLIALLVACMHHGPAGDTHVPAGSQIHTDDEEFWKEGGIYFLRVASY
jgi:hypothetical protein